MKSAAAMLDSLSGPGAKRPAFVEDGGVSAWRQAPSVRTHMLVCVNSAAGIDALQPALREHLRRSGMTLVLDKGCSPRIAELLQGTRASYCPNAGEDLRWVGAALGLPGRPFFKARARVPRRDGRLESGVPSLHGDR